MLDRGPLFRPRAYLVHNNRSVVKIEMRIQKVLDWPQHEKRD